MAAPDRIKITHQRPMTIPTPRAALKQLLARLDQTTDKDGPLPPLPGYLARREQADAGEAP